MDDKDKNNPKDKSLLSGDDFEDDDFEDDDEPTGRPVQDEEPADEVEIIEN